MTQTRKDMTAERLRAYMREHNLTATALGALIYGRDKHGKARGSGGICQLASGKTTIGWYRAELFRDKLGLDLTDLVDPQAMRRPHNGGHQPRALAAVLAYETAHGGAMQSSHANARPTPDPSSQTLRFAMQIGANGRGRLALNLVDRPAAEIIRAAQALQAAGLMEPDTPTETADAEAA